MFTKRSVKIIAIIAAVVFAAVSVTVLAEAVRSSDELVPTEGLTEGSFLPVRNEYRIFAEDYWDVGFYSSPDGCSYRAAVDEQAAAEFIDALSEMAPRLISDEEHAKMTEEGALRGLGTDFVLYFYNSDNELALMLNVFRNFETGEWSNIMEATVDPHQEIDINTNINDLYKMFKLFVIPEENFNSDVIEAVINNAYGGRFDDYLKIKYPELDTTGEFERPELGEWTLYNGIEVVAKTSAKLIPEIDYQTYEDIKDELPYKLPDGFPEFMISNSDAE